MYYKCKHIRGFCQDYPDSLRILSANRSIIREAYPAYPGVQLSKVTEKLNGVTDGGRRKLNGVTDGAPEKGRRGHTFTHTERASLATIWL